MTLALFGEFLMLVICIYLFIHLTAKILFLAATKSGKLDAIDMLMPSLAWAAYIVFF